MKTAISVPDDVFRRAEAAARKLGMSRSELYSRAVLTFLEQHEHEGVTAALDALYGEVDSAVEPAVARAQTRLLEPDAW